MTLTEEKRRLGRRNFIRAVASMPVAGGLIWKASSMTPVWAGIIGSGSQGRVLVENSPPSHIRLSAVCDIFPENLEKGLEIARQQHDPEAQGYSDYRRLLERRDLEAVLIATPLWLHGKMTIEALQAGKHVFCEKTMAYSIEDCRQMVDASQSARRNLQIGHQRNYNPLYQEAKQLVENGIIGEVYHVRALWHRNRDWRRRVPDVQFDPSPWGYPDMEHLKNWRLYQKYSQGLMAELGSHQIQVVNWFSGLLPQAVYGSGGIHRYDDGREVNDHVYLTYDYPEGLTFTYSSIQSNAFDHYYEQFMGTKGTIILSGEKEAMLFLEGEKKEATQLQVRPVADGPVMQASESRARDAAGSGISAGGSGSTALRGYQREIEGFCATIRNGRPNLSDSPSSMNVAVATLKGNESISKGEKLQIAPQLYYST